MVQFILGSHGSLAGGTVSALELLFGRKENVAFVNAYLDDSDPGEQLAELLNRVPADGQCILFADILGGSVHQKMVRFLEDPRVELITGYNLATVLEFVMGEKERYSQEEIERIVEQGREHLQYVKRLEQKPDEDNFFEE
ncbi:PTS sugar transporter subunit IIA [Lacrimispora sp.]|uniref:PTS sugar transporter subunit IIA n=1 Tax=Lacrimispora sp. TaxID=2719234 RepID=UPI00345F27F6